MYNVDEILSGNVVRVLSGVTLGEAKAFAVKENVVAFEQDGDAFDVLNNDGTQYTIEPVEG